MSVKQIVDICKKNEVFRLYTTDEGQWLTDGFGMYPLYGVPELNEGTLCALYDISGSKKDKITFKHEYDLPSEYNFDDVVEREAVCYRLPIDLYAYGCRLIPYRCSSGVVYFDATYFAPFKKIDNTLLSVYERIGKSGKPYYVVKNGLCLAAILAPVLAATEELLEQLESLAVLTKLSIENGGALAALSE